MENTAEQFPERRKWCVDNFNYRQAIEAMATKQPLLLVLIARENCRSGISVVNIVAAAKGCKLQAIFLDSFYCPDTCTTDEARLEGILANKGIILEEFFGHLSFAGISRLPGSVVRVGLAISSKADALSVSSLVLTKKLTWLHVAVSSNLNCSDLKPLPGVPNITLHFYGLTDSNCAGLKKIFQALVPNKRLTSLILSGCQLTAAGAGLLAFRLSGVAVAEMVVIDGPAIEKRDRVSVQLAFERALGCIYGVDWDISWMYGYR